jgi:hypothetical protein
VPFVQLTRCQVPPPLNSRISTRHFTVSLARIDRLLNQQDFNQTPNQIHNSPIQQRLTQVWKTAYQNPLPVISGYEAFGIRTRWTIGSALAKLRKRICMIPIGLQFVGLATRLLIHNVCCLCNWIAAEFEFVLRRPQHARRLTSSASWSKVEASACGQFISPTTLEWTQHHPNLLKYNAKSFKFKQCRGYQIWSRQRLQESSATDTPGETWWSYTRTSGRPLIRFHQPVRLIPPHRLLRCTNWSSARVPAGSSRQPTAERKNEISVENTYALVSSEPRSSCKIY